MIEPDYATVRRRAEEHRPKSPAEVEAAIRDLKDRIGLGDHGIAYLLGLQVDQVRRTLGDL